MCFISVYILVCAYLSLPHPRKEIIQVISPYLSRSRGRVRGRVRATDRVRIWSRGTPRVRARVRDFDE